MINFGSSLYFLLVIICLCCFQFMKTENTKKISLFLINILFLSLSLYFAKKHLFLIIVFLTSIFIFIKQLEKTTNKKPLGLLCILFTFLLLSFFKYHIFRNLILAVLPSASLLLKPIFLLGVSFFTFRLLSLILDIMSETQEEKIDIFHFFNFLLFFPCYLAGPLDRYQRFVDDMRQSPKLNSEKIYKSSYRIIRGLFMKIVMANIVSSFCMIKMSSETLIHMNTYQILSSLYLYGIFLFFDFAGYSEMAIGLSNLFGINTPENFNKPYLARNVQEFWNRWHMSFLSWLKDYIYYPLGKFLLTFGISNFNVMASISFLITFTLAGVWHGDGLSYLIYGVYHGMGYVLFFTYQGMLRSILSPKQLEFYQQNKIIKIATIFVTLNYITWSWFFLLDKKDVLMELTRRFI